MPTFAVGPLATSFSSGGTTLPVAPLGVGNLMVVTVLLGQTTGQTVTSMAGGGITTWTKALQYNGTYPNASDMEIWYGVVTATGTSTITFTWSASVLTPVALTTQYCAQEFDGGATTWSLDTTAGFDNASSSTGVPFPSLTPAGAGEVYVGYGYLRQYGVAGSSGGYTFIKTPGLSDLFAYNSSCTSATQSPLGTQAPAGNSSAIGALFIATGGSGGAPPVASSPSPLPIATFDAPFDTVFSDASGGSSQVPIPFVVAINGRPYLEDLEFKPWKRQAFRHTTVATTRTQADTSNEPGEQSLSTASLWRRTQDSWHLGAGQTFLDRKLSQEYRFRSSKGIDPWTQWQMTLLHDTTLTLASVNLNLHMTTCGAYLYVGDGTALKYTRNGATWTTVTGMPGVAISALCSDGNSVYAAVGSSGIYSTAAGSASATQYVTTALDATSVIRFTMGRLMVGKGTSIYNVIATGALPTALFTSNYGGAVWVDFTDGVDVIYAGMNSGDNAILYAIGITTDGTTLSAPVVAGNLPTGETLSALFGYISGIIAIGSSLGWRFAESAPGTNGSLNIGPFTAQPNPVTAFCGYSRFVYGTYANYDPNSTGIFRMDPSQFTADLVPAWASDLMASAQGMVTSLVVFLGQPVFAISGVGIYFQAATYVPSGTFDSGVITYGLADKKMPVFVDLNFLPLLGNITTYTSYDEEGFVSAGMTTVAGTTFNEIAVSQNLSEHIGLREVLGAGSANTVTPTLVRHTLRAVPAPPIPTDLFVVIQLRERCIVGDVEYTMVPSVELRYLESLCQSKQICLYQEGNNGPYQVTMEEIDWLPEQRSYKTGEMNGVLIMTLRTVI